MVVVDKWTGREASALRQAMRLSIESFADQLGTAPRTISYWRSRPTSVPRFELQQALDTMLQQRADEHARIRFVHLTNLSTKAGT